MDGMSAVTWAVDWAVTWVDERVEPWVGGLVGMTVGRKVDVRVDRWAWPGRSWLESLSPHLPIHSPSDHTATSGTPTPLASSKPQRETPPYQRPTSSLATADRCSSGSTSASRWWVPFAPRSPTTRANLRRGESGLEAPSVASWVEKMVDSYWLPK